MKLRISFVLALASGILGTPGAFAVSPGPIGTTKIIALSGTPAPGGGQFSYFYEPVINNQGQVAYIASLTGIGSGTPNGVFRYDGAATTVVGGPSQSIGGQQLYYAAGDPSLNENGEVTFYETISANSNWILKGSGGSLTAIARDGQSPPSGGTFAYLSTQPRISDSGQVAFLVSFNPTTGATGGVYRGNGGALTEIARLSQSAPNGGNYTAFHWAFPINNSGDVAFAASTSGTSTGGIFRGSGATTVTIARQGDVAPTGDGVFTDLGFRTPALNDAGQVAFLGNVDPYVGTRYGGVFRGSGGAITPIVRQGQLTPSGNESFSSFAYGPVINNRGDAAFAAFLNDPSNPMHPLISIYRGDGTTLTEAMREQAFAPDGNGRFSDFGNPEMNNSGQIAVMGQLSGTLGGSQDDQGLYFFSDGLGLIQVAREGQSMLGSTITSLLFTGGLNHVESTGDEAMGLNDASQVAFAFQLADGRKGAAVWQIPEPRAGVMLLIGCTVQGLVSRLRRASCRVKRRPRVVL